MKTTNSTKETRKTSLRMPESLAQEVEAMAADDSRSFNQMVNLLVERAVEQKKKELSDGTARPRT